MIHKFAVLPIALLVRERSAKLLFNQTTYKSAYLHSRLLDPLWNLQLIFRVGRRAFRLPVWKLKVPCVDLLMRERGVKVHHFALRESVEASIVPRGVTFGRLWVGYSPFCALGMDYGLLILPLVALWEKVWAPHQCFLSKRRAGIYLRVFYALQDLSMVHRQRASKHWHMKSRAKWMSRTLKPIISSWSSCPSYKNPLPLLLTKTVTMHTFCQ